MHQGAAGFQVCRGGGTFALVWGSIAVRAPISQTTRSYIVARITFPAVVAVALLVAVSVVHAQSTGNWAQWRGPLATGEAPGCDPPVKWSETENIKWKVKVPGFGTSTPIIWEDKIFLQTAISVEPKDAATKAEAPAAKSDEPRRGGGFGRPSKPENPYQFVLLCLDRKTGKPLWQKVAREQVPHEGHHKDHGFASSSPVTDGMHVYAYFGSRGLYCYDLAGNKKWEKDLGDMETRNDFGEGTSPALHGNTLVITWDHEGDDFIVALDKRTGDELWRQPRSEPTTWATPLIVEHAGKAQVITPGTERVRTYDLASGKIVWETEGLTLNAIPSPVMADGVVYLMGGFRGSKLLAVKLGGSGDLTDSDNILWKVLRGTPYVPSPLLYEDRLYFFASNNGILSCYDVKTGKSLYDGERIGALGGVYSSPVGAAGRVYLIGREGAGVVIKSADNFEVLATNKLDDRIDASPAVVGNELYLRGHQYLYCIAEE
jgi:outer membrane protein assembly factor BamB